MSDYESHIGKIRKVIPNANETFEELSKRLSLENGCEEDLYYEGYLFDEFYDKFIKVDKTIFEIFDHKEKDYDDCSCEITDNNNGTFSFSTRFYNGGTCLSEMIGDELKKLKK